MAVIWSAVIGGACLALFVGLLLAYAPDVQLTAGRFGYLLGYGLFPLLLGLLGYGVRKFFVLLLGLRRRSTQQVPPR